MIWQFRNFVPNLKDALVTYRSYLVFLLLIVFSLLLLETNDRPQITWIRQKFIFLSALLADWTSSPMGETDEATVKRIRLENIELFKRNIALEDAFLENIRLRHLLKFQGRFPLSTVPSKVLIRSVDSKFNTLILDKGTSDDIRNDQAVITSRGLVGKIHLVEPTLSVCETLMDQQFRVAARMQRTRFEGIVAWNGVQNEVAFHGVLKNLDVRLGDVVLTSDKSRFFQPNLKIGIVTEVNNDVEGLFKSIRVRTAVDFGTLEEVFVITDSSKTRTTVRGFEKYFEEPAP